MLLTYPPPRYIACCWASTSSASSSSSSTWRTSKQVKCNFAHHLPHRQINKFPCITRSVQRMCGFGFLFIYNEMLILEERKSSTHWDLWLNPHLGINHRQTLLNWGNLSNAQRQHSTFRGSSSPRLIHFLLLAVNVMCHKRISVCIGHILFLAFILYPITHAKQWAIPPPCHCLLPLPIQYIIQMDGNKFLVVGRPVTGIILRVLSARINKCNNNTKFAAAAWVKELWGQTGYLQSAWNALLKVYIAPYC